MHYLIKVVANSLYLFFQQELKDFKNGLTMTGGDWGSFTQLFFDNLSTLLGALFAIQSMTNFGVSRSVIDEIIFGRIVPGVGITLVLGNVYYSWQAIRLTNRFGRQYTAQPYGLNTPAAFAFVFNIIYTVYFSKAGELGNDAAFLLACKFCRTVHLIPSNDALTSSSIFHTRQGRIGSELYYGFN
jgi:hypothetical protein